MRQRRIGGLTVGAIGFGCAPLSIRDDPDDEAGVRTLVAAMDAGVTLFDSADVYNPPGRGAGHSERLLRRALDERGAAGLGDVVVATKGGKYWSPEGSVEIDGRPEYLRGACVASLQRLGVECLPLYFLHERDPAVPYAESVGALADLRREGLIAEVGVSNVDLELLAVARDVVPVAAVENQYGPTERASDPVIDRCTELGIAFLPWGSLRGLRDSPGADAIGVRFGAVATRHDVSVGQVVIAWLLERSPVVIPIPGSTRAETIRDCVAGAELVLDADDLSLLDAGAAPVPPG